MFYLRIAGKPSLLTKRTPLLSSYLLLRAKEAPFRSGRRYTRLNAARFRCGRVQRENAPRGKKGDRANVHHYVVAGGANPTVQCDAVRSSPTRPLRIRASRLRRFGGRTVPGTAAAEQRDRNDKLEARVEGLEKEHDEAGQGAAQASCRHRTQGRGPAAGRCPMNRAGPSQVEAGGSDGGMRPTSKPRIRREYPDLVTREPAPDDEDVFGDAWPLIVEWRELMDVHPHQGNGLAWLAEEERPRLVELALLEEHGMTLPPEKQPLRGLDRSGQITWRRSALYDTRRTIGKRELLRWVRRVCTLGLWRK